MYISKCTLYINHKQKLYCAVAICRAKVLKCYAAKINGFLLPPSTKMYHTL